MTTRLFTCISAAVLVASADVRAAELLLPTGKRVTGEPQAAAGTLRVGDASCPYGRIVSLRVSDRSAENRINQGIALKTGDVISGAVSDARQGKLSFKSDSFGEIELKTDAVQAIALAPRDTLAMDGMDLSRPGALLTNGDLARGKLEWFNGKFIGINTGKRIVRVPRDRVSFIRTGSGDGRAGAAAGSRQFVRLASGDRISGKLISIDANHVSIETGFAGAVRLPMAGVIEIWSEGAGLVPLSTLKPAEVKRQGQFDEDFPWHNDRSVLGNALTVKGRIYERGIGCHSRCEIQYEIGGRYKHLLAEVGIDDGGDASGRNCRRCGEVVFRVIADGRSIYQSDVVRSNEAARPIHVSLAGVKTLRLIVDFGPDGLSWGDHADWCRAVLVE